MKQPQEGVFEYHTTVTKDDIDILNHVNNLVYLRWSQEAAFAHWSHLAPEDIQKENSWVIVRNEVDYLRPAFLDNEILVYTWVGEHEGAKSVRYVKIYSVETKKILAEVKTTWCLVDPQTMRSKPIDEKMTEILSAK